MSLPSLILASIPIALWLLTEREQNGSGKGSGGSGGSGGGGTTTTPIGWPPPYPVPSPPMPYNTYGREMPFIASLPQGKASQLEKRDHMILTEVKKRLADGTLELPMSSVVITAGDWTATIPVLADALKLDGVRVTTDFETAQLIADVLGLYQLTPKVSDAINEQAMFRIEPTTRSWNYVPDPVTGEITGAYTQRMIDHSVAVDQKWEEANAAGTSIPASWGGGWNALLVNNPGKIWTNTIRNWEKLDPKTPPYGANHGWYRPGGLPPIQTNDLAHDVAHVDYSQILRFMGPAIYVTPKGDPNAPAMEIPMAEALTSSTWAPLVSDEGPLPLPRHPRIPPLTA